MGRLPGLRLGDRVGLLDVGSEVESCGTAHVAIVGTRADSPSGRREWQASDMDTLVLILLTLALAGIVVAALMTIGVALSRKQG